MTGLKFAKQVVARVENDIPPGQMNTFLAVGDINGNGRPDMALCGRNGVMVWLENKGGRSNWMKHLVDRVDKMECGGSLVDLTGNGNLDIINGGDFRSDEVYWWENPGRPGVEWTRRALASTGATQIHDTIIGDVTGDGTISLVFTNQHGPGGTAIYRVPLPDDPTLSPWPNLEVVATGKHEANPFRGPQRGGDTQPEEGLAIGDVDGDGKNELVAGTHWYKYVDGKWEGHKFATDYITTKIAIGDIDGDGRNEILLSEGDPCVYGKTQGGKLGWFKSKGDVTDFWEEHVLEDGLLDAHTLQLGDITGNCHLDILAGEVGEGDLDTGAYTSRLPRILVFGNDGQANFTRHVIDEGTGIHDGVLIDTLGRGALDIVCKPLHGPDKWNVIILYNDRDS
jgi:hypothetical protein